jgi:hypothetical protein
MFAGVNTHAGTSELSFAGSQTSFIFTRSPCSWRNRIVIACCSCA